jgi:hypothetical protein
MLSLHIAASRWRTGRKRPLPRNICAVQCSLIFEFAFRLWKLSFLHRMLSQWSLDQEDGAGDPSGGARGSP